MSAKTCPACHGTGIGRAPGPYICPACAGSGTVDGDALAFPDPDDPDDASDTAGSWE